MGEERIYYDPDRVVGARMWFWGGLIGVLDWAQRQTYGRVRGFLWGRWHAAYVAHDRR